MSNRASRKNQSNKRADNLKHAWRDYKFVNHAAKSLWRRRITGLRLTTMPTDAEPPTSADNNMDLTSADTNMDMDEFDYASYPDDHEAPLAPSVDHATDWIDVDEDDYPQDFEDLDSARNLLGYHTRLMDELEDAEEDTSDQLNGFAELLGGYDPSAPETVDPSETTVTATLDASEQPEFKVFDGSVPRNPDHGALNPFHMSIALFSMAMDLSESQYVILTEVLEHATMDSIRALPKSLKTLRKWLRRWLPLQTIKGRQITVATEQVRAQPDAATKTAYYFDIKEYGELWVSNPLIKEHMHFGLGHFTDTPKELWNGRAWMESARTTSGQFIRIIQNNTIPVEQHTVDDDSTIILPSDCVRYRCGSQQRIGFVVAVGKDFRQGSQHLGSDSAMITPLVTKNELCAAAARVYPRDLREAYEDTTLEVPLDASFDTTELIFMEGYEDIIPVQNIIDREYVFFLDYESPSKCQELLLQAPRYHVIAILYHKFVHVDDFTVRTIDKRHRITAETEIMTYGRDRLISSFTTKAKDHSVYSLPYTVFLDGFGLYRNSHHSLDGLYIIPASLEFTFRNTLTNVNVWMLGPPGADQNDLAQCIKPDSLAAAAGFEATLPDGERVYLVMTVLAYTADLPQQNKLAGIMSHQANHGCRSCTVHKEHLGDPDVDVPYGGRYAIPAAKTRAWINQSNITARETQRRETDSGMKGANPPFLQCHPCFDPFKQQPNDPSHAELRLAKYFHGYIIDVVLTPAGQSAYLKIWQTIELPHGWPRPQNPLTHKGSMQFNENGRLACIQPFILHRFFSTADSATLNRYIRKVLRNAHASKYPGEKVPDLLIHTSCLIARCIFLALKETLTLEESNHIHYDVMKARAALRKCFRLSDIPSYAKKADVPNIHLAVHYPHDLEMYGTLRNSSVMIGEQKHKIFKAHAPHTNQKENELQLLRAINLSQSVRHVVEGTYNTSKDYADITASVNNLLSFCPRLRQKFIGTHAIVAIDQPQHAETALQAKIDFERTQFHRIHASKTVDTRKVPQHVKAADCERVLICYAQAYGIETAGLRPMYSWHNFVTAANNDDPTDRLKFRVGGFFEDRAGKFYRIDQIITATHGSLIRVFFDATELSQSQSQSNPRWSYMKYTRYTLGSSRVLSLIDVKPGRLHMVPIPNPPAQPSSWFFNPIVPKFI